MEYIFKIFSKKNLFLYIVNKHGHTFCFHMSQNVL